MTTQTNFQKVKEFNIAFGISRYETENSNVFEENQSLVKLRLDLIKEESSELEDAYNNFNCVEIIDALADIEYVIHGCADSFGINLDDYLVQSIINRNYLMSLLNTNTDNNKLKVDPKLTKSLVDKTNVVSEKLSYLIGKHSHIVETLERMINKKDFNECKNLLVELYDSVSNMSYCLGVHIDYIFDMVHKSNMSKLCSSMEEALETQKSYQNDKRYDSPMIRESPLKGMYVVFNQSTGKALKSVLYKPVTQNISEYIS